MTTQPAIRAASGVSLLAVLAATLVTLGAGALVKQPCASGAWADGRQYRRLCYSDIVPLYGTEHLQGGRLPYLDACPPSEGQCDEYPVLTMYLMRLAGWASGSYGGFFWINALVLSLMALVTVAALYAMAGERSLYFAVAPTLLIYAFVNWDLLAVALATTATLVYLVDQDGWSGILLGLGAAAKLYPALLLVPFCLGRLRERRAGGAISIAVWAAVAYAVVDGPFILFAGHQWLTFFRYNTSRLADFDSFWHIACDRIHLHLLGWHGGGLGCSLSPHAIDQLSLALFAGAAAILWWGRRAVHPNFSRWTFGFPLLVAFLLANKVYSPQYGLWLLPWFPLALPNVTLFALFEGADIAVFVTRFSWFGRYQLGIGGVPSGAFQVAVVIRAAVLIGCLVAWVVRREDEPVRPLAFGRSPGRSLAPQGSTA